MWTVMELFTDLVFLCILWCKCCRSFRKNREVHVDIGAQYWTKFTAANDDIRALLMQKRKLVPFDESAIAQDAYHQAKRTDGETGKVVLEHVVCPDAMGFRSMVQELLEGSYCCVVMSEMDSYLTDLNARMNE